jgi:chemotaxis protein histidine kinase CheA
MNPNRTSEGDLVPETPQPTKAEQRTAELDPTVPYPKPADLMRNPRPDLVGDGDEDDDDAAVDDLGRLIFAGRALAAETDRYRRTQDPDNTLTERLDEFSAAIDAFDVTGHFRHDPFPFQRRIADALESLAGLGAKRLEYDIERSRQVDDLIERTKQAAAAAAAPDEPEETDETRAKRAAWQAKRDEEIRKEVDRRDAFAAHFETLALSNSRIAEVLEEVAKAQRIKVEAAIALMNQSVQALSRGLNLQIGPAHSLVSMIRADGSNPQAVADDDTRAMLVRRCNEIDSHLVRVSEAVRAFASVKFGE